MPTNLTTLPGLDPYDQSLLLQDGDLAFAYNADGLRELQMISGIENLAQGLVITVETPLGSDIFNQLFGFDLYSILQGGHNLAMTKNLIHLHVVKTISSDDRVLRIEDVVFDDDVRFYLNQGADPTEAEQSRLETRQLRKSSRRWQLQAVIQPVSGEVTAIPIDVRGV
jgi:phage baseplate assembly protein W